MGTDVKVPAGGYTAPVFDKGPQDGSPTAILTRAAAKGTVAAPPYNIYKVTDTGSGFTVEDTSSHKTVTIPKGATLESLQPDQKKALNDVTFVLGKMDATTTPTKPVDKPKVDQAPKEKVQVKTTPKTSFDPTATEFNNRFDATIGKTDLQAAGKGLHYLGAADAAAVCKALGFKDVAALQKALNAGGIKPPLAVDGKLGGRTLQALTAKVMADKTFAFPDIKSADDAKAFARVTELIIEQASTTESATDTGALKTRLTEALRTAIGKAPADVQTAITAAADGMTSTGTAEGDAADAKSILTTSAKPDVSKIATMSVDDLIVTMTKPGAMDGDSGTAIRERLKDPAVLLKVAANATAMANTAVSDAVIKAIGDLDAAGVKTLATGLGKDINDKVRTALLARIDVLAGQLSTPSGADTLVSLRESWFAIRTSDTMPAAFDEAAIRMVKTASLTDLQETDGVKPAFLEKLSKVYASGPLPKPLTDEIAKRISELKADAKTTVVSDRTALGKTPAVDKVYWQIVGKMADGIHGREDEDINALIKELGEVDSKGNMSAAGSAKVGALIERLKADNKWDALVDDYGRSERKDLLRIIAHVDKDSVSAETIGQIATMCYDRLGKKDPATETIKATVTAILNGGTGEDKANVLKLMRSEPELVRGFIADPKNFKLMVDAFPDGHVATLFRDAFKTDEQRVAFMNSLIDIIADPRESAETRKWAMEAVKDANQAFRDPLEDGDLQDVQDHLNTVNAGAAVPPDAVDFLRKFHKELEDMKANN